MSNTIFGKLKAFSSKRTKSVNHRELLSIAAAFSLICEGGKRNGWCDFAKIVPKCHQMVHLKKYVGNFFCSNNLKCNCCERGTEIRFESSSRAGFD